MGAKGPEDGLLFRRDGPGAFFYKETGGARAHT